MKKLMMLLLVIVLGVVLTACGGEEDETQDEGEVSDPDLGAIDDQVPDEEEPFELASEDELLADDEVVAIVNGEEILGEQYNISYLDVKNYFLQQGGDVEDLDLIREQAINFLISEAVLIQDALDKGITASEEEIDQLIAHTKETYPSEEEYEQALENHAHTEETFRRELSYQLIQQQYANQEFPDIEVSEEDIKEFYAQLEEQMDDLPELEEIRPELETQLEQNESQRLMAERIETLREQADYEILI
ncbi:hypothetical protein J2T56_001534 [Natronobacillus azotifigens]|uniref:SurA N-terminal domain-containing protein n=1 Tax=Natronobacillus azotifigens TaxID=472978 RepID=A0A9J6RA10_9BACI|nr:SurA N-terminal domain-containing protein [Natronobacillus azotifigens]MCZ0702132.1 SurA N-terminal domain-containing protein [Natronobacillus azotifigens]